MDRAVGEEECRTGPENKRNLKIQKRKLSEYSQIRSLKNNQGFFSFFMLCLGIDSGHEYLRLARTGHCCTQTLARTRG